MGFTVNSFSEKTSASLYVVCYVKLYVVYFAVYVVNYVKCSATILTIQKMFRQNYINISETQTSCEFSLKGIKRCSDMGKPLLTLVSNSTQTRDSNNKSI